MGSRMQCPYCDNNVAIIRAGVRRTKVGDRQMYRCKICGRKFTIHDETYRKKYSLQVISYAWRRHQDGLSATLIRIAIKTNFGLDVSLPTLYNWFKQMPR